MLFATTKISLSKVYSHLFFLFILEHFLIFLQDQIPHRSGIVCRENLIDYFGPFAARAFRAIDCPKRCINQCSYEQLLQVPAIGLANYLYPPHTYTI